MNFKIRAAATVALTLTVALPVAAEVLDFDDLSSDGGTGGLPAVVSPCFGDDISCLPFLDERGYRFTSVADGIATHAHLVTAPYSFETQSYASNGTHYIGIDASNISFSRVDGRPFALTRIDAAEGMRNSGQAIGFATKLSVTGLLAGGGTVSATFDFDGVNDGAASAVDFQTFELPSGFNGLTAVTLRGGGSTQPLFSVDNLHVSTVPLPPSVALFGVALVPLVAFRRRSAAG